MDIVQTLREYIIENFLFEDDGSLQEDTSFLDSGIIDSTGILELVSFIEEEFEVNIEDEEMLPENLDSLKAVKEFVSSKL